MKEKQRLIDYLLIVVGTGLMAFAISSIYDPVGLVTGGVSGLAIMIKELTRAYVPGGIPLGWTNLALNVPIFLVAKRVFTTYPNPF